MLIDTTAIRRERIKPYLELMEKVVVGELDLNEFECAYLNTFKNDPTMWGEAEFRVMNSIFLDLDSYSPDGNLRGPDDLDENQMMSLIEPALKALKRIFN